MIQSYMAKLSYFNLYCLKASRKLPALSLSDGKGYNGNSTRKGLLSCHFHADQKNRFQRWKPMYGHVLVKTVRVGCASPLVSSRNQSVRSVIHRWSGKSVYFRNWKVDHTADKSSVEQFYMSWYMTFFMFIFVEMSDQRLLFREKNNWIEQLENRFHPWNVFSFFVLRKLPYIYIVEDWTYKTWKQSRIKVLE